MDETSECEHCHEWKYVYDGNLFFELDNVCSYVSICDNCIKDLIEDKVIEVRGKYEYTVIVKWSIKLSDRNYIHFNESE